VGIDRKGDHAALGNSELRIKNLEFVQAFRIPDSTFLIAAALAIPTMNAKAAPHAKNNPGFAGFARFAFHRRHAVAPTPTGQLTPVPPRPQ
jgi:hypothetical protein